MEIEKICRTCLGLSGPLLSIFDDGGAPSSVAQMLSSITQTQPKRADKLPEKVCLTCISEINHCYSFKLKCESSNRTLRQLLPDAVPEESWQPSVPVERKEKAVQAVPINERRLTTVGIQCDIWEANFRAVQPALKETNGTQDILYATESSPTNLTESIRDNKKFEADNCNFIQTSEYSSNIRRSSRCKILNEHAQVAIKRKLSVDDTVEEDVGSDGNEILLEFQPLEPAELQPKDNVQAIFVQQVARSPCAHTDGEDNATYYEITDSAFEYDENDEEAVNTNSKEGEEGERTRDVFAVENESEQAEYDFKVCSAKSDHELSNETETRSIDISGKPSIKKQASDFKCPHCVMSFAFYKNLKKHILNRHKEDVLGVKLLEADLEELTAAESNKAITPERVASPPTPVEDTIKLKYFCHKCNSGFALNKSLKYHMKRNCSMQDTHRCDQCSRVFISDELLSEHKATHSLGIPCGECTEGPFSSMDLLNKHMFEVHKRNVRNQCSICKKVFTMLSSLKDHMRTHSGERPFVCEICNKAFSQNANLKQHMMRHTNTRKFKCDECESSYVTKAELFSHKRTHNGEQPFKCEFCGAGFTSGSSLVKHKRKHTGERPYACDICPARFATLNVLKNHRRVHTGEKPYKCTHCDKRFTQRGDCQIHQRTHTGQRRYLEDCECGKQFTHLSTYRQHLKTCKGTKKKRSRRTETIEPETPEEFHVTIINEDGDVCTEADIQKDLVDLTTDTSSVLK